jgi:hypothetical protein
MTANIFDTLERIRATLEVTPHLLRLGRLFSETFLFEVDAEQYYLVFEKGHLVAVDRGASTMRPWRVAVRTDAEALGRFWTQKPEPGFHDLFGLVKIGRARIEGDLLPLMRNLRFIKETMALPRLERVS